MRAARARAREAAARERRVRRERRLRALVTRLTGCLDFLPESEGRYLALRAGVGSERPQSRRAAARQAGIPAGRAATTERRGLRRLRRAARAGGCGAGSAGASVALTGATGPQLQPAVLMAPAPALRSAVEMAGGGEERDRQGVKAATASSESAEGAGGAGDGDEQRSVLAPLADSVDEPSATGWYVLLAAVAALSVALLILQRRDRAAHDPALAGPAPLTAPPPAEHREPRSEAAPLAPVEQRAEAAPLAPDEPRAEAAPLAPAAPRAAAPLAPPASGEPDAREPAPGSFRRRRRVVAATRAASAAGERLRRGRD